MHSIRVYPIVALLLAAAVPSLAAERYAGRYTVTAYCSCRKCCGNCADGLTATGKRTRWGMVAADWRRLPPGTRVRLSCFPGQTFVVEDKGGAIRGRRLDVWHPSHRDALRFGIRRNVEVWIVSGAARH